MRLPTRTEAIQILETHGSQALAQDGLACLRTEHAGMADLLESLTRLGKIDVANFTGMMLLLGLMLQVSSLSDHSIPEENSETVNRADLLNSLYVFIRERTNLELRTSLEPPGDFSFRYNSSKELVMIRPKPIITVAAGSFTEMLALSQRLFGTPAAKENWRYLGDQNYAHRLQGEEG